MSENDALIIFNLLSISEVGIKIAHDKNIRLN